MAFEMQSSAVLDAGSMATEMLHVRLDAKTKEQAAQALELMGLSVAEPVRVFLHRVAVEQAIPFAIKVPNAPTRAAMEEVRALEAADPFESLHYAPGQASHNAAHGN